MKEDYCSFKISKLLKEKGFDWDCRCYYFSENNERYYSNEVPRNNHKLDADLACPTHQMAMKWLRDVHKIFIEIGIGEDIDGVFGYMPEIYYLDGIYNSYGSYTPNADADTICDKTPTIYEEAVEAALRYSLENLI